MPATPGPDDVLDALDALVETLRETRGTIDLALSVAARLRSDREAGHRYADIVAASDVRVVELVTEMLRGLFRSGSQLRRAEAQALAAEGLTMQHIAEVFGVSRQRIAELLQPSSHATPTWWGDRGETGPEHEK